MKTTQKLKKLLNNLLINVVDVGAADGLANRWQPIASFLQVIAFEPDARSNAATNQDKHAKLVVVPKGASAKEGQYPLYLTRKPRCSSLLKPNANVIQRHADPERYDVLDHTMVECTTIDETLNQLGITPMDFVKIDTQGSELDVLKGAEQSLSTCLGIEVEVEFQQLYEGASVFREVDAYINQHGFELYDLRRTFFLRNESLPIQQKKGQLVFGDALYFKDWRNETLKREQLIKLAILMLAYGYVDVVKEMAEKSKILSSEDKTLLLSLLKEISPASAMIGERKDTFIGSGFQLN